MRLVLAALLVFIYLIVTQQCARAELNLGVGLGKGVLQREGFERAVNLAYTFKTSRSTFLRPEVGGYLAYGNGRRHSAFASILGGFQVAATTGLHAYVGIGPTYLTHPDNTSLSGHFQFNVQGGLGLRDDDGVQIGIKWVHLSNAGIVEPNRGLDLVMLDLTFCWF